MTEHEVWPEFGENVYEKIESPDVKVGDTIYVSYQAQLKPGDIPETYDVVLGDDGKKKLQLKDSLLSDSPRGGKRKTRRRKHKRNKRKTRRRKHKRNKRKARRRKHKRKTNKRQTGKRKH